MADTAQFNTPDVKPNWLYIGGGIFGVIALIYLLSRNKSSSGTVAAGSSINAALGSIQEEQQNLLGLSTQIIGGETYLGNTIGANQQTNLAASTYLGNEIGKTQQILGTHDTAMSTAASDSGIGSHWIAGPDTASSDSSPVSNPYRRLWWAMGPDTASSPFFPSASPYAKA